MFFAVASGLVVCFVSLLFVVAILRNPEIKPHPFTWGIWSLLGGVGLAANLAAGGGLGATPLAAGFIMGLIVLGFAVHRHSTETASVSPWIVVLALAGLLGWFISGSPLVAAVCVVVADSLAGFVTLKKIWLNPASEPVWWIWALNTLGFTLGLFALEEVSIATVIYPAYIACADVTFTVASFFRSRHLKRSVEHAPA